MAKSGHMTCKYFAVLVPKCDIGVSWSFHIFFQSIANTFTVDELTLDWLVFKCSEDYDTTQLITHSKSSAWLAKIISTIKLHEMICKLFGFDLRSSNNKTDIELFNYKYCIIFAEYKTGIGLASSSNTILYSANIMQYL